MAGLQTEFDFILPKGFVDNMGTLHRKGKMRLATAMDEISPLRDPRVKNNQAYLTVLLLARVITQLGTLSDTEINTGVIERLFASDLAYLQAFYNRVNASNQEGVCPSCGRPLETNESEQEAAPAAALGG